MVQSPSKVNPCTHEQYFLLSVKLRPLGNTRSLTWLSGSRRWHYANVFYRKASLELKMKMMTGQEPGGTWDASEPEATTSR